MEYPAYDPEYYEDLEVRLYQAMQSVFVRWGQEMIAPESHDLGPLPPKGRWQFEEFSIDVMQGPRWSGEVYFRLAELVHRAMVQSEYLDDFVKGLRRPISAFDVHLHTYGVRSNMWDTAVAWYPCAACLATLVPSLEAALRSTSSRKWLRRLRLHPLSAPERPRRAERTRIRQVRAVLHRRWRGNPRAPLLARALARGEAAFIEAQGLVERLAEVDHQQAGLDDLIDFYLIIIRLQYAMDQVMACGAAIRVELVAGIAWEVQSRSATGKPKPANPERTAR